MFAVTGITGNVGGEVARHLLTVGKPVRAVVRDARKSTTWKELGCDVAVADIGDTEALARAFAGVEGIFVLVPPNFDPTPGFPEARATATTLRSALEKAPLARVVYLSTIGAQATQPNLLTQHTIIEQVLRELAMPITFLRAAWFMENSRWDVGPAREQGIIRSFLQPLEKPVPMVATSDIGRVAAELLQEKWDRRRVVELEGPHRVAPDEIAATFSNLLGRSVRAEVVPHESWESLFLSQG